MLKYPYIKKFTLELLHENSPIKSAVINSDSCKCLILHEYNDAKDDSYYELSSNILKSVNMDDCPLCGSILAIFKKAKDKYESFGLFVPREGEVPNWISAGSEGMRQLEIKINSL